MYYNAIRGKHGDSYANLTQESAFAFGYGLSYTDFSCGPPRLSSTTIPVDGEVSVSVEVDNRGNREGTTVVQLYVKDVITSATWASQELKGWKRVNLAPGEMIRVEIPLRATDL